MDFSPGEMGILASITTFFFVLYFFYSKEQVKNNFLENRLRQLTEEEIENKSMKQIKMEQQLELLGSPLSYEKLMTLRIVVTLAPIVLFLIAGVPIAGIVLAVLGFFFPKFYIVILQDRRDRLFAKQLPTAINQLLSAIQAGQTPVQGFKLLSESPFPIGQEFKKVHSDITTGASVETALEDLYKRNPVSDIKLLMTGIIVAQNTTPAVAVNTLKIIISTIRQRDSQKKSALSTVAQGKLTALVLALLPVVVFLGLVLMSPDYVYDFLDLTIGKVAYLIAAILDIIGFMFALKITSSSRIVNY